MVDDTPMSTGSADVLDTITRRATLRRLGAFGATGAVGLAGGVGTAAALHCENPKDDDDYKDEESKGSKTEERVGCGDLRFCSSTDLAYMGSIQWENVDYKSGTGATHFFYFVTEAGCELKDGSTDGYREWPRISKHEVDLQSDNSSTSIDICQNNTGIYPSRSHDSEVQVNWDKVAELALAFLSSSMKIPLDTLVTAASIVEAVDYTKQTDTHRIFERDRVDSNDRRRPKTKVQGTFELNVPGGEACYVDLKSTTEMLIKPYECGNYYTKEFSNTEDLYIYADDDDAVEVLTYDPDNYGY